MRLATDYLSWRRFRQRSKRWAGSWRSRAMHGSARMISGVRINRAGRSVPSGSGINAALLCAERRRHGFKRILVSRPRNDLLMKAASNQHLNLEVCILTGGLSTRMGRDKSRLRLGPRTMLGHIRVAARRLGFPVRTIRHDSISRSGPIGGIYTALRSSNTDAVLFLACDMPFVSVDFLQRMIRALCVRFQQGHICMQRRARRVSPAFSDAKPACRWSLSKSRDRSFPLRGRRQKLSRPEMLCLRSRRSLQELTNINTPAELKEARSRSESRPGTASVGRPAPNRGDRWVGC